MKSIFQQLAEKVKKDLDIELINLKRTYAGHWQRSSGAFVWFGTDKSNGHDLGSSFSATYLLKSKKLILSYDYKEIFPIEDYNIDYIK